MSNQNTTFEVDKKNLTVTVTRVFDAPRMMLWAAVSDASLIKLWWGPDQYEMIVDKYDFKEGGEWRFIHKDTKGTEYGFHGITTEIIPMEKVVQTFNYEGIPAGRELIQTMLLEDVEGGKTKMTTTAVYKNIEDLEGMVQSGMERGQREGLDRLAELTRAKKELTIVRVFNAPRDLVFKAWTDPKLVAEWWGPSYFTNPVCELDPMPGGKILIHMKGPDGSVSPMGGKFEEVKVPEKLVFISNAFGDDNGNNPKLENRNTVTFEEITEGENKKTKVTLHVDVIKSSPETEIALSGMEMGWRQSLDKLEKMLEK